MNPNNFMANNVISAIAFFFFLFSTSISVTNSSSAKSHSMDLFPKIEITLSNDDVHPVWFMCQMTNKSNSLHELQPNATYRYEFIQVAFPMRWCYLYINPNSNGFFWSYTVRSRCTKCFWSINKHPHLYRGDRARWERQKLFMPPSFNVSDYFHTTTSSYSRNLNP